MEVGLRDSRYSTAPEVIWRILFWIGLKAKKGCLGVYTYTDICMYMYMNICIYICPFVGLGDVLALASWTWRDLDPAGYNGRPGRGRSHSLRPTWMIGGRSK